jgi:REP element-mobilizing transposase RayT
MPDHPRGYTTRDNGYRAPDERMSDLYHLRANHAPVVFTEQFQRWLIDAILETRPHLHTRVHGVATESTHVHMLVSWDSDRPWEAIRKSIRTAMTRHARAMLDLQRSESDKDARHQPVFSDGGSRKQVHDRSHFAHLMTQYLPDHSGLQWFEDRGWIEPRAKPPT